MDERTYDYECKACGFTSAGWSTKAAAKKRGEQHQAEHESGNPMPELNQEN